MTHTLEVIQHLQAVPVAREGRRDRAARLPADRARSAISSPTTDAHRRAAWRSSEELDRLVSDERRTGEAWRVPGAPGGPEAPGAGPHDRAPPRRTDGAGAGARAERPRPRGHGAHPRAVEAMQTTERGPLASRQADWRDARSRVLVRDLGRLEPAAGADRARGLHDVARLPRARDADLAALGADGDGRARSRASSGSRCSGRTRSSSCARTSTRRPAPSTWRRRTASGGSRRTRPPRARSSSGPATACSARRRATDRALHVRDVPAGYLPVSSALGQRARDGAPDRTRDRRRRRCRRWSSSPSSGACARTRPSCSSASRNRSASRCAPRRTARASRSCWRRRSARRRSCRRSRKSCGSATRSSRSRAACSRSRRRASRASRPSWSRSTPSSRSRRSSWRRRRTTWRRRRPCSTDRAEELERANQYKSEFLANMSHELRTPLNSSLILAKLLADNKDGNLSDEQVRFAQTIYSAGQRPARRSSTTSSTCRASRRGAWSCRRSRCRSRPRSTAWSRASAPMAAQKGLAFTAAVEPGTPERIETDAQRLGQILKNLLSNAIKFTEAGGVSLRASGRGAGCRRLRRARHRHRHPGAPAGDHLRGLPPGGRQHAPQVRRHRPRPLDLARPGAPAGRRHRGRAARQARAASSR